ncbi:bacteriocin immunity protein [Lactiplantibacillus nangangensis]|uniref:Bacteriocin immunity protein n=1 Tax=Lactiplantibacillus nangangensis TaxID=2559917 RepID=A0ABW1SGU9_9LACO|nr:bacteriocin immunity protein [Lactiplantibacillus nangangensis]
MVEQLIGVVVLALGIWQLFAARAAFLQIKRHGTKSVSSFIALGLWSGLSFGVLMLLFGAALIFNQI